MKLLTYIQQTYHLPRRAITEAIKSQMIRLDGELVEGFAQIVTNNQLLQGYVGDMLISEKITIQTTESDLLIFHKPIGYVCSKSDTHNRTIYSLVGKGYHNYYYIGRLDKDTRGLVLLTNDSYQVNTLEHPRSGVEKEYIMTVKFADPDFARRLISASRDIQLTEHTAFVEIIEKLFRRGLLVDDEGLLAKKGTKADLLKVKSCTQITKFDAKLYAWNITRPTSDSVYVLRIILTEGKKRHLRRLLRAVGGEVRDLLRVRIGNYELGELKEGELAKA